MRQENARIVRSVYDAFMRRDARACMGFFAPDAEWTSAENFLYADQSPYLGIESIRHLIFDRVLGDWEDFSLTAGEILADGELAIARGRFKGKFKANGASIDAEFVHVFQFRKGKIAKCQTYTDTAQFKETIGRSHPPEKVHVGI
jgi:ketosteroid isomerase-like protein